MNFVQIVDYNGGRTLEDLIKFVEKRVAGEPYDEDEGSDDEEGEGSDDESEGEEAEEVPRDEL